jgi:hypothetical protein
VSADTFRAFAAAVGGASPQISSENVSELGQLASEFAFAALTQRVREFLTRHMAVDLAARRDIGKLDVATRAIAERSVEHDRAISEVETSNVQLHANFAALRDESARQKAQIDALLAVIARLEGESARSAADIASLRQSNEALAADLRALRSGPGTPWGTCAAQWAPAAVSLEKSASFSKGAKTSSVALVPLPIGIFEASLKNKRHNG